jgi:outer membrane protein assembly factor BamB
MQLNFFRALLLAGIYLAMGLWITPATAQNSIQLFSDEQLRSIGLEKVWHSQLEFDATRGRLSGVYLHYNENSLQTLYEIKHSLGREVISERDLDPFGRVLGAERAKEKALAWIEEWKARHPNSKEPVPDYQELEVPDAQLVSASQRGMVQALNAETGSTLWVTKVGSERLPTSVPAANENFVAVLNGSKLFLIDKKKGEIAWERYTTYPPGGGPVLSTQFVFVPMVNGILESYDIEKYRRPATNIRSHGRIMVQPVVFKDAIAWTTDRGMVYVGNSEAAGVRFRVSSQDVGVADGSAPSTSSTFTPGAPTFLTLGENKPTYLYFGTPEGQVYCCEADRGNVLARFSAGEPISQSPVVVKENLYAITDQNNLFCMDSRSMQEKWMVPSIKQFVASSENHLYVVDQFRRLVALDVETGSRIGSVSLGNIDFIHTNAKSDRIYLGSSTGVMQCLREINRNYPWVHAGSTIKKKFQQILNQNKTAEEGEEPAMEEKPAAVEDPFGAPAPAPKKEAVPAVDDDPFAS